jgi:hypothetical protein
MRRLGIKSDDFPQAFGYAVERIAAATAVAELGLRKCSLKTLQRSDLRFRASSSVDESAPYWLLSV